MPLWGRTAHLRAVALVRGLCVAASPQTAFEAGTPHVELGLVFKGEMAAAKRRGRC